MVSKLLVIAEAECELAVSQAVDGVSVGENAAPSPVVALVDSLVRCVLTALALAGDAAPSARVEVG